MAKQLFEYTVFLQEKTDKDGEVVEEAEVLVPITVVLARDEGEVNILAARAIPDSMTEKLERITLAVRPF